MTGHDRETVYLLDASACIHRAYHAIAPLSAPDGQPTNAVFGFVNILLGILRQHDVGHLAVAFDLRGPTFRHQLSPAYKANRPPMPEDLATQIPLVHEIVAAYGFTVLKQEGVEADDLIAAAAAALNHSGIPVVVVTGDKDLLQLVSPTVTVWDPMKDVHYDPAAVIARYGLAPDQLLDYFALVGDASDNIAGATGIGPKTAARLLQEHGGLDQLLAHVATSPTGKVQERLAAETEQVLLARRLVALKSDLPVPAAADDYTIPAPDNARLREIFSRLGFSRLLKKEIPAQAMDSSAFGMVTDSARLHDLAAALRHAREVCLDTETTSLAVHDAALVGMSLAVDSAPPLYIPVGHVDKEGRLLPGQLPLAGVLSLLKPELERTDLLIVGHNLKYDFAVLKRHGVTLKGRLWDTMIASYLLDPGRRSHGLDDLCRDLLELGLTSFATVTAAVKADGMEGVFARVPLAAARDYSCEDVQAAILLKDFFAPRLKEMDMEKLFAGMECPLIPVLANMELAGIGINRGVLVDLGRELASKLTILEQEIHLHAGGAFNVQSPKQLGEVLFERLGLPQGKKTKTGFATDVQVLEKLAHLHPVPRLILQHRNLAKLKSTYADKLVEMMDEKSGRIHTSFNQTVTTTGRLSSSSPNLQNIPIRGPEGQRIRQAFIPAAGQVFVAGDYSQIDLRVLAHYSGDDRLCQAFVAGDDIHTRTAAEIYGVDPRLVTAPMRRTAKTINFGIVYGMSGFGLAGALQISRQEANLFIERYFAHYAGVKKFMEEIVVKTRQLGYASTLFHRRRPLPEINSPNRMQREFAERAAINTPVQGTAADIIKLAMLAADRVIAARRLPARMLLQIHDELVFEVEKDAAAELADAVRRAMEDVCRLAVPLVVNMSCGDSLAK